MDLADFLFNYGSSTTTNFDLKNIAKQLNIKTKVLMKDELKDYKKPKSNAVINFQNSNQSGTHWVALHNSDTLYYFDTYARSRRLCRYRSAFNLVIPSKVRYKGERH